MRCPATAPPGSLRIPSSPAAQPPTSIRREFGISPYALDPTREETYQFIARFLGEMATIFPDPYMHIGGDETPAPDWKTNPRILAFMKAHHLKDSAALQAYFNTRVLKILTGLHKHMVGWDEILNPALPKDVVIQSWRGEASLAQGAEQGYQGILSRSVLPRCNEVRRHTLPRRPAALQLSAHAGAAQARPRRRDLHVGRAAQRSAPSTPASGRGRQPSPSASGLRKMSPT